MKYIKSVLLLLIIYTIVPVYGEYIIYDNITIGQYKSIQIDDITNIKYINDYHYDVYLNDSFYGSYEKGEIIVVPNNVYIRIVPSGELSYSLSSDSFTSIIGAGFYSFIQYGVYIIIFFFIIIWILKRKRV